MARASRQGWGGRVRSRDRRELLPPSWRLCRIVCVCRGLILLLPSLSSTLSFCVSSIFIYICVSSAPAGRSMLCCAAVNGFEVLAPEILSSTRATVFRVLYGCLLKSVCLRVRVYLCACMRVCVCVHVRAESAKGSARLRSYNKISVLCTDAATLLIPVHVLLIWSVLYKTAYTCQVYLYDYPACLALCGHQQLLIQHGIK